MRPGLILPALLLLLAAGGVGVLSAYDGKGGMPKEIIVTLYQAQNVDITDDLADQPKLKENLIKLFGYQRYQRVGTSMVYPHSQAPVTAWPNKLFSLTVQTVNPASPRYDFELKQEGVSVLKGSFIPKPGIPIIIKGPLYGSGQLILIVDSARL
ncbi:MAG: hypothetical protein HC904_11075 [Blastochloris sp.]|nr:hypothetical protein [Blastochloris sp.]